MTSPVRWILIVIIGAASASVGCGNGDDGAAPVPLLDAAASDVVLPAATLRVANWSPDLSIPAVDVCLSAPGLGAFQEPVLAAAFGSGDGGVGAGPGGVSFAQVSAYVSIASGPYDVRFVSAGAADCSQGLAPDLLKVAIASGTTTSLALFGLQSGVDPATTLSALSLVDDGTAPSGKLAMRFVNALPSTIANDGTKLDAPTVDFGTGATSDGGAPTFFKPLYVGVPFGGASNKAETQVPTQSATASVDSRGYGAVNPIVETALTAHQSGATFDLASATVSIAAGAVVTAVLLPAGCYSQDGGCAYPAEIAVYVDNAGTTGSTSVCLTCADGGP